MSSTTGFARANWYDEEGYHTSTVEAYRHLVQGITGKAFELKQVHTSVLANDDRGELGPVPSAPGTAHECSWCKRTIMEPYCTGFGAGLKQKGKGIPQGAPTDAGG